MKITTVNGVRVVADDYALSPLSKPGKPVTYSRIRELVLEDGTTWYGCGQCGELSERLGQIRYHLRTHRAVTTSSAPAPPNGATKRTANGTVNGAVNGATKSTTQGVSGTPHGNTKSPRQAAPTTSPAGSPLTNLTLSELADRIAELGELDMLRGEVARLTAELDQSKAQCAELRTGHDELLAATRNLPDWKARAEAAEMALGTVRAALNAHQSSQ